MKNKNIPLKRGQIWLDSKGIPKYKLVRERSKYGWEILHIPTGQIHISNGTGLPVNFTLADESIIDQLLEKYS